MKNIWILLIFSTITLNHSVMAQSLTLHEWENRVVLLFTSDFQNENLKEQLSFFQKSKKGLVERKLIVYQITPNEIKKDGISLNEKVEFKNWFKKFKVDKKDFTFVLIGLDGSVKMKSTEVVSIGQLFSKIDRMPMRQAEIKRNKN